MDEVADLSQTFVEGIPLYRKISFQWGVDCSIDGKQVDGLYVHDDFLIQVRFEPPTQFDTLSSLATKGMLPRSTEVSVHEEVHAAQFNLGSVGIPRELMEAQAYRSGHLPFADFPHDSLVNHVSSSKAYPTINRAKFDSAVWYVDRLRALGYTQEEIINVISGPGRWDSASATWGNLDELIAHEMHNWNLDFKDLEEVVKEYDVKAEADRQTAKKIVKQVLDETLGYDLISRGTPSNIQGPIFMRADAFEEMLSREAAAASSRP